MRQEETLSAKFPDHRFAVELQPNFLFKVIERPHVVVAPEKMHRNPGISNLSKLSEQSHIPFWHNGFVFKPEIEQVAHQENLFGVGFYNIEPADEFFLPLPALLPVGDAEVKIGGEVYFFAVCQYFLLFGH